MYQFARFAATRAGLAIITLVMVSFIVFSLMELVPGDCAERYLAFKDTQGGGISVADIENERIALGWTNPISFAGETGSSTPSRANLATVASCASISASSWVRNFG